MKKPLLLMLLSTITTSLLAGGADTLEVQFSDGGKLFIIAKDRQELIEISDYDINKILDDIVDTLQSSPEGTRYLVVSDEISREYEEKTFSFDFNIPKNKNEQYDDIANYRNQDLSDKNRPQRRFRKTTYGNLNLDFGLNNYFDDSGFPSGNEAWAIKPWGSWYVAVNYVWNTKITGVFNLEYGAGFSWYNFKLDNDEFVITRGPQQIEYIETDPEVFPNPRRSKLTTSYFGLHLVPIFDFGRGRPDSKWWNEKASDGFRIGAGFYGGYRLGGHSKFVWGDGSKQKNRDRGNFFLNNWRYGIRGQIGYEHLDLFVNYDLNNLFEDGRHPAGELNAISFGIIF